MSSLINHFKDYTASTVNSSLDRISQASDSINNAYSAYKPPKAGANYDAPHGVAAKVIADFRAQLKRGNPVLDLQGIAAVVDALRHTNEIDDRKMLLENLLTLMSRLPDGPVLQKFNDQVITLLYNDLSHPPATFIGNKNAWRSADGSGNNPLLPDLGKSGTPYARSVQPEHPLPPSVLPDPDLLFDALLRREKYVPHPAGLSSLMFSFAALVIHTCFRTSHTEWSVNETSSYVDLSPLYGYNQEIQDKVRNKDGRGKLHPDVFAEDRLLFLPPASAVILVLFNRNHNYVADKLLELNEKGTYNANIDKLTDAQKAAQDDSIFNVARLINCGWFGSIVFSDYLSAILGLARYGSNFSLNPNDAIRKDDHTFVDRGSGNACSVEFNMLYRWHATTSLVDQKWTETVFDKVFDGKPYDQITVGDYAGAMRKLLGSTGADVTTWSFGNLTRGPDGRFKDADLAAILQDSTSHPASAFKARGTPDVLRIIEVMGIRQARSWGVCSMNEFRKFLGLKPFESFEEWNPRPEIHETAKRLYGDIENLELYVGLQAEEAKPLIPGAGLCPGYTVSRAILADAIALIRGDRFFTTDFTPYNLTTFGFADCARDTSNPSFGGQLGRLFLRTLPNEYNSESTYTWFPLFTPETMHKSLVNLGLEEKYTFDRPVPAAEVIPVGNHNDVDIVLTAPSNFEAHYAERARRILPGRINGFFIADEYTRALREQHQVQQALFGKPDSLRNIADYFATTTLELIEERSFGLSGKTTQNIDIVRDVLNSVPIYWVSQLASLPLKTKKTPFGSYVEAELYQMFSEVYSFIFEEGDPSKYIQLLDLTKGHADQLLRSIKAGISSSSRGLISAVASLIFGGSHENEFVTQLRAAGRDDNEIANNIFAIVIGASVLLSQSFVHVINLYLDDDYKSSRDDIIKLARLGSPRGDDLLEGYVREALRLDPAVPGVYRVTRNEASLSSLKIPKGSRVFASLANAGHDPSSFPNPNVIDPKRPKEAYQIGNSALKCLGDDFVVKTGAQVLRAVFSLPNLRRGPGVSGTLNRTAYDVNGTRYYEYLDSTQKLTPWAQSMIIQYDLPA
ncbi:linoleate diol synthase [Sistotremastrum suecicum HHB10207 ss-3]|uniref:Linoleate diol synthase n=1 Tax=Sistotremastrum suecicum HHB10207 ss-3 TaxID=1314776 RepID=A0A166D3Q4_9AGAM|nr:linoleate diol synthase [Sistotremastrum suecicum HHB10207 ss-3]